MQNLQLHARGEHCRPLDNSDRRWAPLGIMLGLFTLILVVLSVWRFRKMLS